MSPNLIDISTRFHTVRRPPRPVATLHGFTASELKKGLQLHNGRLVNTAGEMCKNGTSPKITSPSTGCIYTGTGVTRGMYSDLPGSAWEWSRDQMTTRLLEHYAFTIAWDVVKRAS